MFGKKKNKNNIDTIAIKKTLKTYLLPIVSMGLFILIVIFLIVPKVGEIFGLLDQISIQNNDYDKAKATLTELEKASEKSNEILAQLNVVNETTPTGRTEVVKFRDKITELTQKNGIQILSQRLSENSLDSTEEGTPEANSSADKLTLQEVPFSFEIQGEYSFIINFINDLSVIDDFIIVRQMELNAGTDGSENGSKWILKLTINKYQFSQISEEKQQSLYSNVPINAEPSQNVLDYVNKKID